MLTKIISLCILMWYRYDKVALKGYKWTLRRCNKCSEHISQTLEKEKRTMVSEKE